MVVAAVGAAAHKANLVAIEAVIAVGVGAPETREQRPAVAGGLVDEEVEGVGPVLVLPIADGDAEENEVLVRGDNVRLDGDHPSLLLIIISMVVLSAAAAGGRRRRGRRRAAEWQRRG